MPTRSQTQNNSSLALPPEIRLRIYEAALPAEIILKFLQFDADVQLSPRRIYQIRKPQRKCLPFFMFANKLVFNEVSPLFWSRVVLDGSNDRLREMLYEIKRTKLPPRQNRIHLTEPNLQLIRHMIIPVFGYENLAVPIEALPNLQKLTIYVRGQVLFDVCINIAAQLKKANLPWDLDACFTTLFNGIASSRWTAETEQMIGSKIPSLAERYTINLKLSPRFFRIARHVILDTGERCGHIYKAELSVSYEWNTRRLSTRLEDVAMITKPAKADERGDWARHDSREQTIYTPEDEESWYEEASFDLLEVLIFKELRKRGLIDCDWVKRWTLLSPDVYPLGSYYSNT